jgi:MFS family permease
MTAANHIPAETTSAVILALLPLLAAVLVVFLITGVAIPVLPLHVHQGLGLGTFVVGLVTGTQFGASLISRVWSGHYADRRGAKRAVVAGLLGPPPPVSSTSYHFGSSRLRSHPSRSCSLVVQCLGAPKASSSLAR